MKWTVIDTIACPITGIAFSSILSLKMLKIVIWYKGDVILAPGAVIEPCRNGIVIDGKYTSFELFNITTFNNYTWKIMKDKIKCPKNTYNDPFHCSMLSKCALKICPRGVRNNYLISNICLQ
jgi:hypothetical protein